MAVLKIKLCQSLAGALLVVSRVAREAAERLWWHSARW